MISLRCDNRSLTKGAKISYLATNYSSGVGTLTLISDVGFADNDYLLLGEFGSETSEIVQINGAPAANVVTLGANTEFAHAESTKVTILKYNNVIFYRTTDTTFSGVAGNLLTASTGIAIQADSYYTVYQDIVFSSGYGWFCFYNVETAKTSTNSNYMPYSNFESNQIKTIIDTFYSAINNAEQKLISNVDAFSYLNEAYSVIRSEFNLSNDEYFVASVDTITTVANTQEYDLESDFSKVVSVWNDDTNESVGFISLSKVSNYDNSSSNTTRYYIRNSAGTAKIGFSPVPSEEVIYKVRYKTEATILTSYSESIDLPDGGFFLVINYMLFKSGMKLGKGNAMTYYKLFTEGINRLKLTSHKRDNNLDSWSIAPEANA